MLVQQIVNGLTIGVMYSLVALGYTLTYSILRLINFAHGDLCMVGAFLAFTFSGIMHWNIWISMGLAMLATGLLGAMVEFSAFRPLRKGARSSQLTSAIGVSMMLQNLVMLTYGSATQPFKLAGLATTFSFAGATFSSLQIVIVVVSLALMAGLNYLIYFTRIGVAMRAVAEDPDTCRLLGTDVDRVISFAFATGSLLGAAAGALIGLYYSSVVFNMGYVLGLKAFVAAILGGIGSIPGTMLGGILLGVSETLGAAYFFSGYKDAIAFVILILVLLVKPSGILGRAETEKV